MKLSKIYKGAMPAAILLAISLLSSCAGDSIVPTEPDGMQKGGPILFGTPAPLREFEWQDGRAQSRAGVGGAYTRAGEGAQTRAGEIGSETPENIGVFAFGDGPNTTYIFRNQKVLFRHGNEYLADPFDWEWPEYPVDTWPYSVDPNVPLPRPWEKMRYRFFAYSPWYPNEHVSVTAENYQGFNSFTWDNIPGFTDKDFVLCNEISDVDNREGEFTSLGNIIHFRMRHILSRIRFFFKLSTAYHQVRHIELNSITVLTAGNVKSATFNFKDNAWDETVHWSNVVHGDAEQVTLTNLTEQHYFIPYAYPDEPFTSVYVYPQENFDEIKLQLNYTVYDSEGIPTRHAQLINSVSLPNWTLLMGYYYDIRISIAPAYLYVLSDNDQTFDGYVIVKDEL